MSETSACGGFEVRLRPVGFGRYFDGGFLLIWLAGWALGAAFAVGLLVAGLLRLLRGELAEPAPAIALGAFLALWLTFWTIGGVAALRELLRSFWAEDRLVATPPGLRALRRLGPFRTSIELRRDEIGHLRLSPSSRVLVAETVRGTTELSTLDSVAERQTAGRTMARELGVPWREAGQELETAAGLPDGWSEIVDAEGGIALTRDPLARQKQARVAALVASAAAALALYLLDAAWSDAQLIPLAAIAVTAATGLAWGAIRLARGRQEWRIGVGRIVLRHRFGRKVRERFEAVALELTTSRDGDGDEWFALEALAPGGRPAGRRTVARAIHEPDEPRRIARWIVARARIPLVDRTTRQAREAEIADLRRQLEQAGPLGRWLGRWVDRARSRSSADAARGDGGAGAAPDR